MAIYFPNFRARAGATRARRKPRPGLLPVALYFPNFRARAGATRLGASRGRVFFSAVFRPPYTADAALGFKRHLGQLSWPRPLGRNRRGLNMPLRHVQHRSRTKVCFAPLLSQSARLKPMLADIFCECESPLNFRARAGAHLSKAISSHKKMPASLRAFCFTVCDRRGRTPSTLRRRIHHSYSAAEWWDCCSCAPERDR